ncbi:Protein of unknown function (DUF1645) [Abeliophyllum distichum]|uniref:Uncharacterized protein n=1 Tax=Abeliophyllum distichum TaxID=126358 RepID=A0ABD1VST3_9LAMI
MLLSTTKNDSISTTTSADASPLNLLYEQPRFSEDVDSTCSTPYVSAPSSPGHASSLPSGYFFSAPASPMHFLLSKEKVEPFSSKYEPIFFTSESGSSFEFEFCSRLSPNGLSGNGSMSSADELFLNGKIRPMKLSSHLKMPQVLVPLVDLGEGDDELGEADSTSTRGRDVGMRNTRYAHRKTRSLSPFRTTQFEYHAVKNASTHENGEKEKETEAPASAETTPSGSASSSRSSSSGRNNSKKWMFLKDLLHRSKSEGRANNKDRFWSAISFSPAKEQSSCPATLTSTPSTDKKRGKTETAETQKQKKGKKVPAAGKPANGVWKHRVPPSAHELHYTAKRAQAEEMKKKTFLPYRQGLLGFLGFSSKNYGTFNGPTRTLNPVSSG